ncbi:MAG: hypothetical protein SFU98_02335 [Leptospiraceae bacterium]|nr:hypothetical protein [Leptospiraceae bacterium]
MNKKNGKLFRLDDSELDDEPKGTGYKCYRCKHSTNHRVCKAFGKIPDDIWLGKVQHTSPYPGDNGIQFEEMD